MSTTDERDIRAEDSGIGRRASGCWTKATGLVPLGRLVTATPFISSIACVGRGHAVEVSSGSREATASIRDDLALHPRRLQQPLDRTLRDRSRRQDVAALRQLRGRL